VNQNKLTFESENLVVDYISFNIAGCIDTEPIANYLSEFGFNSVLKESFKAKSEVLVFKITNKYNVDFIKSSYNPQSQSFWTGLTLKFSDEHGKYFYSLVKNKLIDWCIFDLFFINLGRFDFYYFRKSKPTEDDLPELFMKTNFFMVSK
jgi:hypothetical protein